MALAGLLGEKGRSWSARCWRVGLAGGCRDFRGHLEGQCRSALWGYRTFWKPCSKWGLGKVVNGEAAAAGRGECTDMQRKQLMQRKPWGTVWRWGWTSGP